MRVAQRVPTSLAEVLLDERRLEMYVELHERTIADAAERVHLAGLVPSRRRTPLDVEPAGRAIGGDHAPGIVHAEECGRPTLAGLVSPGDGSVGGEAMTCLLVGEAMIDDMGIFRTTVAVAHPARPEATRELLDV